MNAGGYCQSLQCRHDDRPRSLIGNRSSVRNSVRRGLGRNGDDDRLDLTGDYIQNDACLWVGAKQCSRIRHQSFTGAMLLTNVSMPVKNVVEVVRVLKLSKLVSLVAVNPGNPLAGQFDRAEGIGMRSANLLDGRREFRSLLVPVSKNEMRWDRTKYPHCIGRFNVATMENQFDVLLQQKAYRFRDRLLAVVGIAYNPDPHGLPAGPVERNITPLTLTNWTELGERGLSKAAFEFALSG